MSSADTTLSSIAPATSRTASVSSASSTASSRASNPCRLADRPVCWFLAGAALLDIDASGRRGVELPKVRSTYWPHRVNFERLERSSLDWRLLCPGPMVDQPPLGLERLRISLDRLPVEVPAFARALPRPLVLPVFASLIPQMIVPYADAAALMLANLDRGSAMARHRVGLALPVGMRGRKPEWTARSSVLASETFAAWQHGLLHTMRERAVKSGERSHTHATLPSSCVA